MKGYEYILAKQTAWADNCGILLVGSKGKRGRPAYTPKLHQNLFQALLPEVRESFAAGDGGELGSPGLPGKMQAVHSSSALGVNVFQYWSQNLPYLLLPQHAGFAGKGLRCHVTFVLKKSIQSKTDLVITPI